MKRFLIFISIIFISLVSLIWLANAQSDGQTQNQKTLGEKWKEEQYKKIDQEAEKKKQELREKIQYDQSGLHKYGGPESTAKIKEIERLEKQIDEEAKKRKREVDETYEKLGPAKNKPYKGN